MADSQSGESSSELPPSTPSTTVRDATGPAKKLVSEEHVPDALTVTRQIASEPAMRQELQATIVWNGHASELILDDTTQTWHLANDDGSRVEYLTGGGVDTHQWADEHWRITTQDGTQYWFGRNQLPGWTAGKRETGSVFGQPTFANRTWEPGYSANGFNWSWTLLTYRWNLDYVAEPNGSTMAFYYLKDGNRVRLNNSATSTTVYNPGGWLDHIEYGTTYGHEYDNTTPPMKVVFGVSDRCLASCWDGSGDPITANWPDMAWDLYCKTTATTCTPSQNSPSFWTTKRLTSVTTQVYVAGAYRSVDRWDLAQDWPGTGDGTDPSMWLRSIQHTGLGARMGLSDVVLPSMTFDGGPAGSQPMANRTDYNLSLGVPPVNKWRIKRIFTETGGEIDVGYEGADCWTPPPNPQLSLPDPAQNYKRCFPQYYVPPDCSGSNCAGFSWWNKYRVASVTERDLVGSAPDVVHSYLYWTTSSSTNVLWHHDDEPFARAESYRSWSDFRGWSVVTVITGAAGTTQSAENFLYYRGLNGDKTAAGYGTRSVSSTDSQGGTFWDAPLRRGFLQEHQIYDAGQLKKTTINWPKEWSTAQRVEQPYWTQPTTFVAGMVRAEYTFERTSLTGTSTWRVHQTNSTFDTTYGQTLTTTDWGDVAASGDESCARNTYNRSPGAWLVDRVSRTEVVAKDCNATVTYPQDLISDERAYFDGATSVTTAPTKGNVTKTDAAFSWSGGPVYRMTSTASYDSLGRVASAGDALGRTTTTTYNPPTGGPVVGVSATGPGPFNHLSTITLDSGRGVPLTVTDPNNKVTTGSYDPLGRLVKVWQPGRATNLTPNMEYVYGVPKTYNSYVETRVLGPTGAQVSSFELYDGLLRLYETQVPAPVANNGSMIVWNRYDSRGLTVNSSTFFGSGWVPNSGALITGDDWIDTQHRYSYDGLGRQLTDEVWKRNVKQWQTTTAYWGDHVNVVPPTGGTSTDTYSDVFGKTTKLRQYVDSSGNYQDNLYSYDKAHQLSGMTDAAGNHWSYEYDLRGRQTRSVDPDKGETTSTYDDAGQLLTTTDARPITLAYAYDTLGRTTAVWKGQVGAPGIKLADSTYDTIAKGYPTAQTRYLGGNAYTTAITGYDDGYRPLGTSVTLPTVEGNLAGTWTTARTYKVNGALESVNYPAAGGLGAETVTTSYDTNGFPSSLAGTGSYTEAYVASASYYPWGDAYQRVLGSGTKRIRLTTTVDEATRRLTANALDTENQATPGSWVNQRTDGYTYNNAGGITAIKEQAGATLVANQCFGYDGLQRLTNAWTTTAATCQTPTPVQGDIGGVDAYWHTHSYDSIGNRTQLVRHGYGGDTTYTYPTSGINSVRPHAVQSATTTGVSGSDTYTYGPTGAMATRNVGGTSQVLAYDDLDQLATHSINGQATTYIYGTDRSRLLRKDPGGTVTAYLDGYELQMTAGGTVTATRFYADVATRTTAGGLTWTASDHHGTASVAIHATTLTVTTRRFRPFGDIRTTPASWPNEHGYVGGVSDPTGLTHLGAREYDPVIGRFTSIDPVMDPADPQQWNAYSYASNSPITGSDPSGLRPCDMGEDCVHQTYGDYPGVEEPNLPGTDGSPSPPDEPKEPTETTHCDTMDADKYGCIAGTDVAVPLACSGMWQASRDSYMDCIASGGQPDCYGMKCALRAIGGLLIASIVVGCIVNPEGCVVAGYDMVAYGGTGAGALEAAGIGAGGAAAALIIEERNATAELAILRMLGRCSCRTFGFPEAPKFGGVYAITMKDGRVYVGASLKDVHERIHAAFTDKESAVYKAGYTVDDVANIGVNDMSGSPWHLIQQQEQNVIDAYGGVGGGIVLNRRNEIAR